MARGKMKNGFAGKDMSVWAFIRVSCWKISGIHGFYIILGGKKALAALRWTCRFQMFSRVKNVMK